MLIQWPTGKPLIFRHASDPADAGVMLLVLHRFYIIGLSGMHPFVGEALSSVAHRNDGEFKTVPWQGLAHGLIDFP
jgi:hypothetical protein